MSSPEGRSGDRGDESALAPLMLDDPVIVLACARSGSTLLRVILDEHADLACPPETNIAKLCSGLWDTWMLFDPECTFTTLTEEARLGIRTTIGTFYSGYLIRQGKVRWCDKSLESAEFAGRLSQIYDNAKFICLYRHAMDMVNSGLEAVPFGLRGYGFDPYRNSSNSVAALIDYWTTRTALILEFEQSNPDRCLRVYYEQLVLEPEKVTDAIFNFIGVGSDPGITQRALVKQFQPRPFEFGDHKILASRTVTAASVGRGMRVPTSLMTPDLQSAMNQLLARLGYTQVDRNWDMSTVPPVLLATPSSNLPAPEGPVDDDDAGAGIRAAESSYDHRLADLRAMDDEFKHRVSQYVKTLPQSFAEWSSMAIVAYSLTPPRIAAAWRVDREAGTVDSDIDDVDFESLNADWVLTGEIEIWRQVLNGAANLATAVRHGFIKCIGKETADGADLETAEANRVQINSRLWTATHILGLGGTLE